MSFNTSILSKKARSTTQFAYLCHCNWNLYSELLLHFSRYHFNMHSWANVTNKIDFSLQWFSVKHLKSFKHWYMPYVSFNIYTKGERFSFSICFSVTDTSFCYSFLFQHYFCILIRFHIFFYAFVSTICSRFGDGCLSVELIL